MDCCPGESPYRALDLTLTMSLKNPFEQTAPGQGQEMPKNLMEAVARLKEKTGGTQKVDPETRKLLVGEVYENLRRELLFAGAEYTKDVGQLIKQTEGTFVVRREDPERLLRLIKGQEDLVLKVDPKVGEVYANSVEWTKSDGSRGLSVAFQEGKGDLGGIAMVAGYQAEGLDMQIVPNAIRPGQGIDRSSVRCTTGTITSSDVRFIMTRVAAQFVPEDELTEAEIERLENKNPEEAKRMPIFRGFLFPEKQRLHTPEAAE